MPYLIERVRRDASSRGVHDEGCCLLRREV